MQIQDYDLSICFQSFSRSPFLNNLSVIIMFRIIPRVNLPFPREFNHSVILKLLLQNRNVHQMHLPRPIERVLTIIRQLSCVIGYISEQITKMIVAVFWVDTLQCKQHLVKTRAPPLDLDFTTFVLLKIHFQGG